MDLATLDAANGLQARIAGLKANLEHALSNTDITAFPGPTGVARTRSLLTKQATENIRLCAIDDLTTQLELAQAELAAL